MMPNCKETTKCCCAGCITGGMLWGIGTKGLMVLAMISGVRDLWKYGYHSAGCGMECADHNWNACFDEIRGCLFGTEYPALELEQIRDIFSNITSQLNALRNQQPHRDIQNEIDSLKRQLNNLESQISQDDRPTSGRLIQRLNRLESNFQKLDRKIEDNSHSIALTTEELNGTRGPGSITGNRVSAYGSGGPMTSYNRLPESGFSSHSPGMTGDSKNE